MGDDEDIILLTCGNLIGKLHRCYFLCPGIHQECIEVDGQLVTPKMFSVMGDKEKLKDWKNAIRVNGRPIRKVMDSGELDFWDHDNTCTGRCVCRNAGISKYDTAKFNMKDELSNYIPLMSTVSNVGKEHAYDVLRKVTGEELEMVDVTPVTVTKSVQRDIVTSSTSRSRRKQDTVASPTIVTPDTFMIQEVSAIGSICPMPIPIELHSTVGGQRIIDVAPQDVMIKREHIDDDVAIVTNQMIGHALPTNGLLGPVTVKPITDWSEPVPSDFEADEMIEDSQSFWRGVIEVGFLDEVFREIKSTLDSLKNDIIKQKTPLEECRKLTKVVQELNLMTKIKWKMAAKKDEAENQEDKLKQEIEALKRKMQESEQKQRELKRKAECYDQLMEMGRPKRQHTSTPTSSEPSPRNTPKRSSVDSDSDRSTPQLAQETPSPAPNMPKSKSIKGSTKHNKGQSDFFETRKPIKLIEVRPLEIDEDPPHDMDSDSATEKDV